MEVREGWTRPWKLDAAALPQASVDIRELAGGDAAENAGMLERLLDGEIGARREAVLLNVAVALTVEGRARDVADGYEQARTSVDTGRARARFEELKSHCGAAAGARP
jgi:anthranilate phosphoribosyltransferase